MRATRIGEPVPIQGGGAIKRGLPLWKWRRKDGLASFLRDLISLRKTIVLCFGCEHKMPRRWTEKYDYALIRGFHGEGAVCDYCRQHNTVNMYQTVMGKYHADWLVSERSVRETRERERAMFMKDRKYLIGY